MEQEEKTEEVHRRVAELFLLVKYALVEDNKKQLHHRHPRRSPPPPLLMRSNWEHHQRIVSGDINAATTVSQAPPT